MRVGHRYAGRGARDRECRRALALMDSSKLQTQIPSMRMCYRFSSSRVRIVVDCCAAHLQYSCHKSIQIVSEKRTGGIRSRLTTVGKVLVQPKYQFRDRLVYRHGYVCVRVGTNVSVDIGMVMLQCTWALIALANGRSEASSMSSWTHIMKTLLW
jgi:hypothetical protein